MGVQPRPGRKAQPRFRGLQASAARSGSAPGRRAPESPGTPSLGSPSRFDVGDRGRKTRKRPPRNGVFCSPRTWATVLQQELQAAVLAQEPTAGRRTVGDSSRPSRVVLLEVHVAQTRRPSTRRRGGARGTSRVECVLAQQLVERVIRTTGRLHCPSSGRRRGPRHRTAPGARPATDSGSTWGSVMRRRHARSVALRPGHRRAPSNGTRDARTGLVAVLEHDRHAVPRAAPSRPHALGEQRPREAPYPSSSRRKTTGPVQPLARRIPTSSRSRPATCSSAQQRAHRAQHLLTPSRSTSMASASRSTPRPAPPASGEAPRAATSASKSISSGSGGISSPAMAWV